MKKFITIFALSMVFAACSSTGSQNVESQLNTPQNLEAKKVEDSKVNKSVLLNCSLKDDKRLVEVGQRSDNKLCEVFYKKSGQEERIASAEKQKGYCTEVVSKVKENLEAAGFSCTN